MSIKKNNTELSYMILITVIAALGGTLFGYDQGVISGALNFFSVHFKLSQATVGFVSGVLALGAMAGCLLAGFASDRLGRKKIMLCAGILFTLSSLILAISPSVEILIVGRILSGVAIGMASTIVPLYISEVAPAKIRGTLVSANQLAFAIGMTSVFIVNAIIANTHSIGFNVLLGWRFMFASGMVPAVIFFGLSFIIPESPRFLIKIGKDAQALSILTRINGDEIAKKESLEIKKSISSSKKGLISELAAPGIRYAFLIAILAAIFQQLTGTIAVGYYAPTIFKMTGVGINASLIETIGIGVIKIIFVAIFMFYIDKVGRKKLLRNGAYSMVVALLFLSFLFHLGKFNNVIDILILLGVLAHTAAYELSWGGGAWVILSEIFPTSIRGRALSFSSMAMFLTSYFVTQFFPIMLSKIGASLTFGIFAVFCILMGLFASIMLPETTGKSLEQIELDFKVKGMN
ncbi:sugar porter family MFS transporter [Clostridium estertheticum]|uniref:sugar porter family MFS transporter n=1 Tax=Clostridium estertheticum TaxID=238834 RepID=UPI001CF3F8E4|nr:sugar porter family MFS transporter [Clostridium estertheticum]MCB2357846.1 sugar porter family MFS transporter [Clostridium estertheticum]